MFPFPKCEEQNKRNTNGSVHYNSSPALISTKTWHTAEIIINKNLQAPWIEDSLQMVEQRIKPVKTESDSWR